MNTPINVNDQLSNFTGTECYYKHPTVYFPYTEGIQYLAQTFCCYWLIRDIAFHVHQGRITDGFQVWKLKRCAPGETKFLLTCEDGNYNQLYQSEIPFSDFEGDQVTIWLIDWILILPSEY